MAASRASSAGRQALELLETRWQPIGPDMLLTGYLPATTGLWGLQRGLVLPAEGSRLAQPAAGEVAALPLASTAGGIGAGSLPKPVQRRPEQVHCALSQQTGHRQLNAALGQLATFKCCCALLVGVMISLGLARRSEQLWKNAEFAETRERSTFLLTAC